ncbi:rod shape-determining protein MreC [Thalassoporum mexicanum PCC 7367]|uniref:rod shape-determining protein MreC n=1 Tax=Thalassoporum mexicanum TaxID=3457544 RepID=UPI00029F8D98|nr:rod shape-determining protein MreC [Pseudanabaena sp. PCC 7367]AFY70496.1 rod shape-determining protein MreC [Pseudanabaena sp. PCC 7367]
MESIRRWWERYSIQFLLVSLGLVGAWAIRQGNGRMVMEIYQTLSRPFQETYSYDEQVADASLRELQYRLTELENQNKQFRQVLGDNITLGAEGEGIWAAAIGRSSDSWWQQLLVGRGSSDNLQPGAIALGPGGLIGRVTDVSSHSSRILLISDPTSQVGVTISRTRHMGMLRGQAQNEAILEFFERDPDVSPGDIVLTSPYSTLYPPGIPVGKIKSINLDKQPAPEAVVEFSAPMSMIEFVQLYPYEPKDFVPEAVKGKNELAIPE